MKNVILLLGQAAVLAACADWPDQSAVLDARAQDLAPPALLPQDQLLAPADLNAQARGAALAARAAALQTAAAGREQVLEGLRSGAYYYLTKPFERDMLLSVVRGALEQSARRQELLVEIVSSKAAMEGLQEASFGFRTPAQARAIAALLAKATPVPEMAVIGLNELMLNAVEHGNLEISYDEKSALLKAGRWDQEIVARLAEARRGARTARVRVSRNGGEVVFEIEDEGAGFDWSKYLEFSAERAFDSHGRGISMARSLSFSTIQYQGAGNRVRAVIG